MITNSVSLLAFARANGKMSVGEFTNRETGEIFTSCVFTSTKVDPTTGKPLRTFAHFSEKLKEKGIPSAQELGKNYDHYQVVTTDKGNYVLCEKGESNWQEVNLPI